MSVLALVDFGPIVFAIAARSILRALSLTDAFSTAYKPAGSMLALTIFSLNAAETGNQSSKNALEHNPPTCVAGNGVWEDFVTVPPYR